MILSALCHLRTREAIYLLVVFDWSLFMNDEQGIVLKSVITVCLLGRMCVAGAIVMDQLLDLNIWVSVGVLLIATGVFTFSGGLKSVIYAEVRLQTHFWHIRAPSQHLSIFTRPYFYFSLFVFVSV